MGAFASVWKKNQVAQVFPLLPCGFPPGCRRAKARWFSGYPKTQLAGSKTRRVFVPDRAFPLAGASAAAWGNAGGSWGGCWHAGFLPCLFGRVPCFADILAYRLFAMQHNGLYSLTVIRYDGLLIGYIII